jgi:general secretion pathway protein D
MTAEEVRRMIDDGERGNKMNRPGLVYVSAMVASNDLVLRSNDPLSLAKVKQVALSLDKPRPQVLLEVKVLDVTLVDEHERGIDWLFGGGAVSAGSARGMSNNPGQLISRPDASLVPQGTGLDPRAAIFGVVTEHVSARLQMLQDNNRVVTLATPNLLVADNEASRVFVGTEMTVLEKVSTSTYITTTNNGFERNLSDDVVAPRRRIGTSLLITPKIHADRSVTISILQENTALGTDREIIVSSSESFVSTNVEERSVTTTVVARDGNIIAIGGLITEQSGEQMVGTPGLHRIPWLGELFKRTSKIQERHEMLILIKPHVLLAPGEGEAESLDMMEHLSRHPSASPDFPNLGVGDSKRLPVGEDRDGSRDALRRLKKRSPVMSMEP